MNKCKKNTPFLIDNKHVVNCKAKALAFNICFVNQCRPIESVLPFFNYLTRRYNMHYGILKSWEIDEISSKTVLLCGDSILLPLKIIFENILLTGIFLDFWILFKHLYNYFQSNNLVTNEQSCFRPGDSITNQLTDFLHDIHQLLDDKKYLQARAVFLDISKAFDEVCHEG